MNKLKPCPFCGDDNCYTDVMDNPFSNDVYSRGHCRKCHAVGSFFEKSYLTGEKVPSREHMEERATEQWNTRPIEDALDKRIAELEAMVEKLNGWIDELINAGNQPRHRNWQDNWDAIVYRIIKEREK